MIHASRTAFQEQPNGDLTCTITIPAADRAAVFAADRVAVCLAPVPGNAAPAQLPMQEPAHEAEAFTVQLDDEQAETADDKPPAQGISVDGFDTARVIEAVTSGGTPWNHPAAPHLDRLYRHEPFQQWAMWRLHADAFAAPMECATRLITKAIKGKPTDAAMASLSRKMDQYIEWATHQGLPLWPDPVPPRISQGVREKA